MILTRGTTSLRSTQRTGNNSSTFSARFCPEHHHGAQGFNRAPTLYGKWTPTFVSPCARLCPTTCTRFRPAPTRVRLTTCTHFNGCRARQKWVYDNFSRESVHPPTCWTKVGALLRPCAPWWCSGNVLRMSKKSWLVLARACGPRVRIMFRAFLVSWIHLEPTALSLHPLLSQKWVVAPTFFVHCPFVYLRICALTPQTARGGFREIRCNLGCRNWGRNSEGIPSFSCSAKPFILRSRN